VRRHRLPRWILLGVQAGVVAAMLACGTLLAFQLSRPEPRLVLPNGFDGAMILLPAVLALAVFAVCYPTFMAGTRADAVLGVAAAFLIAADALMLLSIAVRESVLVHALGRSLPLGLISVALAMPAVLAGTLAGQLTSALGFGRSAGLRSALASAVVGLIVVIAGALTI
jgi:hypothetical protein